MCEASSTSIEGTTDNAALYDGGEERAALLYCTTDDLLNMDARQSLEDPGARGFPGSARERGGNENRPPTD
jgi:hypothetical protein